MMNSVFDLLRQKIVAIETGYLTEGGTLMLHFLKISFISWRLSNSGVVQSISVVFISCEAYSLAISNYRRRQILAIRNIS